jgi:hypothetical protein
MSRVCMGTRTLVMTSFRRYASASFHVGPCWTTSCAPAALSIVIMRGFVDRGTTTVQGNPRAREACTAASPAFPPLEEKMCG